MVTTTSLCKEQDKNKSPTLLIKYEKLAVVDLDDKLEDDEDVVKETESCKTPIGKEYKIPAPVTCPPAPRKRKPSPWFSKEVLIIKKPNFISDADVSLDLQAMMRRNQVSCQETPYSPDK
ncbi:hypothetical protein LWI28_019396 [Acer negundo]|uniref:Uncharacterized protein n=1 Tax=Acer negundo TaxID=4023 RepID=A0AAD5J1F3_ACENE|nr:hypothetical protein LWI28_019396 [Acer negundo]KAK4849687.1 hypothetical protein QYF36_027325 [Acer negundo]